MQRTNGASGQAGALPATTERKPAETGGGKPKIEIQGEGKLTFDRKLGGPSKLEAQQKLISREGTKTEETPLKISYRLLSETEKADLAKTPEGAPLFPGEPLPEALLKQTLEDLKSGDKPRQLKAVTLLQAKEPAKADKEMAQALEELRAGGKDATMRFATAQALAKWATTDSTPALLKVLGSDEVLVRHAAMDGLGKLKAESAAEPI